MANPQARRFELLEAEVGDCATNAGRSAPREASGGRVCISDARSYAAGAVETALRDWLETQARVIGYWRELALAGGADLALVDALDAHGEFLETVAITR